ncbi:MAG: MauE/DoxX family redox-associated membrane protein [Actinomycetota bacterium]
MVETITPVVHGGRRSRWAIVLGLHVAGAAAAAGAFGAVLGATGSALGAPWGAAGLVAIAAVGALYLAREAFGLPVPVPQLRRQVPDWWRTYFPFAPAAFLYGMGLGVGFFTFLAHGTLVVVSAAALASGRPALGAALLAPFGLARGLSAVVAMRTRTNEEGAALVERLADAASRPVWRVAHVLALATIVVIAAWTAVSAESVGSAGRVAAAALSIAFGSAAVAKIAGRRRWARALASYRLGPLEGTALVGVPVAELTLAALPFLGLVSTAGVVSLVALSVFSAAIVVGRVRVGRRLDCGCFGASRSRDYRLLLARNGALAVVAVVAWREGVDSWIGGTLAAPSGSDLLPATIVAIGVALAMWVAVQTVVTVRRGASR